MVIVKASLDDSIVESGICLRPDHSIAIAGGGFQVPAIQNVHGAAVVLDQPGILKI